MAKVTSYAEHSGISPTRAVHRWQLDAKMELAREFDGLCKFRGIRTMQRIRELIQAEVDAAINVDTKKRGK